jgi:MFS family permease
MRHATVEVLPQFESRVAVPGSGSLRRLLTPPLARPTILIWLSFFFMMGGYYFVFSWTPKLLTSSGLTAQQGINSGVLLSLGGIAGTVLFAFVARVIDVRRLTLGCLLASAVLMGLFAINATHLPIALIAGVALGGMSTSAMAGFYALTPTLYDADLRASGMGWGIGVGRIGAILAPLATGVLIDHSWHWLQLFYLFAGTFILAGLALAGMVPGVGRALPIRAIG